MTLFMEKRYQYILILAIGITGLILVTSSQQVSAVDISGLWKLNANGEKADLNITVTPGDSGLITGTVHWFGRPPSGGAEPFIQNVIGFWDTNTGKIVFLSENKVVFDKPRPTGTPGLVCNTVSNPKVLDKMKAPGADAAVVAEMLDICHGRDVAFTGYLFGDNNNQTGITTDKTNMMMAGVEQAFAGGSTGVGASPVRNTFGWCATYQVDMCGLPLAKASTMNATSMSNTTETAN